MVAVAAGLLQTAGERLRSAGVDTPELDAQVLLAEATGRSRADLIAGGDAEVSKSQHDLFESFIARRESREPVAYITGRKGFRHIELAVDLRVLIPRPDTETLVAVAKVDRPCSMLDVATGSGAVALALADELPDGTVVASDISPDALEVAEANAARLGMLDRVSFVQSDLLDGVSGRFDCITANLPYVTDADWAGLQPEIVQFEPRLALTGGTDGLDLVRGLVKKARNHLHPGGMLALEIGEGQADQTAALMTAAGFALVDTHKDLAGIERVVTGRKCSEDRGRQTAENHGRQNTENQGQRITENHGQRITENHGRHGVEEQ